MKPPCMRFVWKFTKFDIEDEDPSDNYKPDPLNEHHCEWDSLEGFGFDDRKDVFRFDHRSQRKLQIVVPEVEKDYKKNS